MSRASRQAATRRKARQAKGFTLLEVMIAMAILILALTALFGHQGVAIQMSDYSNKMSQAVLLGQGKMLDLENKMLRDSIDVFDNCEEGDFRDVEMDRFSWKACAYKIEMDDGAAEQITEQFMSLISGFLGGGDIGGMAAAAGAGGANMDKVFGSLTAAIGAIPFFLNQLEDKVRKVRLEITWTDAVDQRTVLLERYVTNLGVGNEAQPVPGLGGGLDGTLNNGVQGGIQGGVQGGVQGGGLQGGGLQGGAGAGTK